MYTHTVIGKSLLVLLLLAAVGCTTVRVVPEDKARQASQYNAELGAKYLQRNQLNQAREKLEKALEQDKRNALAHVSYARLQQHIGDNAAARKHFNEAIDLEPDVADHRNSYGIFLCSQGELAKATTEFEKAAENPYYKTPEFALDNAGLCYLDNGNLDQAETYLRDALRVSPTFPQALLHMAELTHRQKRLTVADAYLTAFQKYGSESPASLSLGIQIRRDMGDISQAQRYANKLLNEYPSSREAGEYLARPLSN